MKGTRSEICFGKCWLNPCFFELGISCRSLSFFVDLFGALSFLHHFSEVAVIKRAVCALQAGDLYDVYVKSVSK